MTTKKKIAVLVGSLREASLNRKLALALKKIAAETLDLDIMEIGGLPLFNPDLDGAFPPAPWTAFRESIAAGQGVLFITPEYNRSVPASIKNAIDVGSRPAGKSVWGGKPCAVISLSPGAIGGFGANHHLRQSLVFLNMPTMQQPEAYLSGGDKLFEESGALVPATEDFMTKFIQKFDAWVRINAA